MEECTWDLTQLSLILPPLQGLCQRSMWAGPPTKHSLQNSISKPILCRALINWKFFLFTLTFTPHPLWCKIASNWGKFRISSKKGKSLMVLYYRSQMTSKLFNLGAICSVKWVVVHQSSTINHFPIDGRDLMAQGCALMLFSSKWIARMWSGPT